MSTKELMILVGLLIALTPASALACKPAPYFTFDRVTHELPSCITVNSFGSFSDLPLEFNNQCDEPLLVSAIDCPRCAVDTLEVGPTDDEAELVRFVLEPVEPAEQTASYRHQLGWELGDDSGTIDVQASYRDNSDACNGLTGCSTTGRAESGWVVLLGLVLATLRRRRYTSN